MEEKKLKKSIIIKFFVSSILLIILIIIFFVNLNNYNDISLNEDISTTNYKSMYVNYINKFISYCNINQFEKAFNLLSEKCKLQLFENNLEKFTSTINEYNFKNKYNISYIRTYQNLENEDVFIFNCMLENKQIVFHIIENKPYDCKLYLVLE